MSELTLIFPHQLFEDHPAVQPGRPVWLIETPLFFYDPVYKVPFHKQKLILHRASMKNYEADLRERALETRYCSWNGFQNLRHIFRQLSDGDIQAVHVVDPTDFVLHSRITRYAKRYGIHLCWYENPNFLTSREDYGRFFSDKKRFFMADFYMFQRKRLGILVDDEGKPEGGKWSFDTENRKKLPRGVVIPDSPRPNANPHVIEAVTYVKKHFADHPGDAEPFFYPVNAREAKQWLDTFLSERFHGFGPFEDAMSVRGDFLFHSVLTPALNIGLLDPLQIVKRALEFANRPGITLASLEGFVRQIIGWREFMRATYEINGVAQRTTNFWKHHQAIPQSFWKGETGILPIDHVIKKVTRHGFAHHIERLMVLGNFMMLCGFDPDEVYHWFMAMFIDSYDWVMVPNVYAMSQYADGGTLTTKPYFSGSNYLRKMSDYPKGDWQAVWDGLFWQFIARHRDFFLSNPRLAMMARLWNKMDPEKQSGHLHQARQFLDGFLG